MVIILSVYMGVNLSVQQNAVNIWTEEQVIGGWKNIM
jgi:hypothetical protein